MSQWMLRYWTATEAFPTLHSLSLYAHTHTHTSVQLLKLAGAHAQWVLILTISLGPSQSRWDITESNILALHLWSRDIFFCPIACPCSQERRSPYSLSTSSSQLGGWGGCLNLMPNYCTLLHCCQQWSQIGVFCQLSAFQLTETKQ